VRDEPGEVKGEDITLGHCRKRSCLTLPCPERPIYKLRTWILKRGL